MFDREVCTIVFYDEKGRILLQDRKGISKFGEEWSFFGGSLNPEETPKSGLIREVEEELDYTLKEFKFFKTYDATLPGGIKARNHVHLAEFPGYEHFNQKEGVGMKLVSIEEARILKMLEADSIILDDLEEYFTGFRS